MDPLIKSQQTENANSLEKQALTETPDSHLATSLAILLQQDPNLAYLIDRWPRLPQHVKVQILALAKGQGHMPTTDRQPKGGRP